VTLFDVKLVFCVILFPPSKGDEDRRVNTAFVIHMIQHMYAMTRDPLLGHFI